MVPPPPPPTMTRFDLMALENSLWIGTSVVYISCPSSAGEQLAKRVPSSPLCLHAQLAQADAFAWGRAGDQAAISAGCLIDVSTVAHNLSFRALFAPMNSSNITLSISERKAVYGASISKCVSVTNRSHRTQEAMVQEEISPMGQTLNQNNAQSGKLFKGSVASYDNDQMGATTVEIDLQNGSYKQISDDGGEGKLANGAKSDQVGGVKYEDKHVIANGNKSPEQQQQRQNGHRKSSKASEAGAPQQVSKVGRIRHVIAILALSSIVLANMNRQAYNQALVRMIRRGPKVVPESAMRDDDQNLTTTEKPFEDFSDKILESEGETAKLVNDLNTTEDKTMPAIELEQEGFDWTGAQIGLLQASFSYGYTFFMIPGGRMSEIYGAKWVIFLSSFGSALCSMMTPFLANTSFTLLVASRVFMGLCQTGISPALYALFSRWLPPDESSVYLPMIKVGVMIGFMSGSLVNGFLPWQVVFYLLGLLGFSWSILWTFFASSLPIDHKFISQEEQKYIQHCLDQRSASRAKPVVEKKDENSEAAKRTQSAPWLRIIKNPVVLAFTFTKFTVKLSTDTQTMQIPMYLRNVFQISDKLNGILNGTNFAIQAVFTGIVAYTAKEMVVRQQFGLRKTGIRRLFQGINCFGMGLAYLLISFNMGSLTLVCAAVILLSVTSMFGAGGEAVLPIDLTTEYSASIMAIANSLANFSGIVLPPIVSFLLANQLTSSEKWNHVWWFVSATMTCGGLMFTLLVKAKIQGFNEGKKQKPEAKAAENNSQPDNNGTRTAPWTAIEMNPTKTSKL